MRRIQKILLCVFAGGILLAGVGSGMALVEYSTLNYGGQKVIGEENLVTKTLEFELDENYQEVILAGSYYYRVNDVTEVIEDAAVPERVVQYEVTYNEKRVRPFISSEAFREYSSEVENTVSLRLSMKYIGDSFGEFMENKDMILNDLKNHTISSYDTNYITKIVIKANPETMDLINKEIF